MARFTVVPRPTPTGVPPRSRNTARSSLDSKKSLPITRVSWSTTSSSTRVRTPSTQ